MSHPMQVEGHCQVLGLLPSAALLLHRLLEGVVYYRASPRALCSTCFWDIAMQSCADCCYVLGALRSSPSSSTWTDWAQRRVDQEQPVSWH